MYFKKKLQQTVGIISIHTAVKYEKRMEEATSLPYSGGHR